MFFLLFLLLYTTLLLVLVACKSWITIFDLTNVMTVWTFVRKLVN